MPVVKFLSSTLVGYVHSNADTTQLVVEFRCPQN